MRPSRPVVALLLAALVAPALAGCIGSAVSAADVPLDAAAATTPLVARMSYLGTETFEPTLGVAPDGAIYYSVTPPPGVAIGFGTGVYKSTDGGLTWEDVSPRLPTGHPVPPETNDPYVYVDPDTGRVFQFAMAPILVCSILSWSDDGGDSWTTNPRGCQNPPPWDHQTMVAAKPRENPTTGYPNVLVQCVNHGVAGLGGCARSLDGGLTWAPSAIIKDCTGLHGHLKAAPDGTLYLPKVDCGEPSLRISRDDGETWTRVEAAPRESDALTHEAAVAVDTEGNLYYTYMDRIGRMMLVTSVDGGETWSAPVVASPPGVTGNLPAIAAGAPGRVVLAYAGTDDLPKGYDEPVEVERNATWDGYLTISTNALDATPVFQSVTVNDPSDPLVRGACGPGRCPGMVDFIDVVVAPDGKPYAAYVDACIDACASTATERNNAEEAVIGTLESGPSLR